MLKRPTIKEYNNSQEAWEGINEYLLLEEETIMKEGGEQYGPALVVYDLFTVIHDARINPNFNFGYSLGYSIQKWSSLVNNYVDMNYLEVIKSRVHERELKNSKSYNISMLFDDSHGSGKGCLLTITFIRRVGLGYPIMHVNIRASEVTKRLIFDLLLFQRIGEYVYGKNQQFGLHLMIPHAYISVESIIMYNNHRNITKLMNRRLGKDRSKWGKFQQKVIELYDKYSTIEPKLVTFKVHLRSVMQIQMDKNGNPKSGVKDMFAKDMGFGIEELKYPPDVISLRQKRAWVREVNKRRKLEEEKLNTESKPIKRGSKRGS